MSKKTGIVVTIVALLSLCCSIVCVGLLLGGNAGGGSDGTAQYVMYVGTNDKDTYQPEHTNEEAKEIVDTICLKHFEGYTLQEATGSWTDEKSNITHEYTLVCYFDGADEATVYSAADEIIDALNQNTVLIERDVIETEYYGGK